jgi:aspartate/methionine/tyrosine aminotransferase
MAKNKTFKPNSKWQINNDSRSTLEEIEIELKTSGKKILDLTVGDPPIWGHRNQELSKYLIEAAEEGYHTYGGKANEKGLRESPSLQSQLQEAIVKFEKRERGVNYDQKKVIYGGGVAGVILMIHQALLKSGDEVVSFEPAHYFIGPTSYFPYYGIKLIPCKSLEHEKWRPDTEQLRNKITNKTKMIVINNPNNPTGSVYDEKILKKVIDIAGEYNLPIMSDEIYSLITFDEIEAKPTAALSSDVPIITLNGMAKFFMRTGWKLGYAAFYDPEEKISKQILEINNIWSLYGGQKRSMATPIIYAASRAILDENKAGREFVKDVQERRDFSMKRINEVNDLTCVEPKGTFYIFPKISKIGQKKQWKTEFEFLIEFSKKYHVLFHPGSLYGEHGFGHIRAVTLPNLDTITEVFDRLEKFLKENV